MTGKNFLKQQLQTGKVDMPSLSGALKESGAVSIELTTFPEQPEETSGSPSEKTETGRKKKGNADKGTVSIVVEREKQSMIRKNEMKQQLQTGNANISSESGALKKSGAVRIVHASVHEPPKKTRGSLTEKKKIVEKKERVTDREAPEKNRAPQNNVQQEMREMRRKNPLTPQLRTGIVNTPSACGPLKKSGAVRNLHASIREPPKKSRRSLTKEKKTIKKRERIVDKVAFDKREEPEKNRPPQDNVQQEMREIKNKKMSGALKKGGAVDFVLLAIYEQPEEASGSPSEERGSGKMKQGDDNEAATNTPGEELEETRL